MKRPPALAALLALLAFPAVARAHVGSPDAVEEGAAGPYHLLVTIRPPQVIPGIAQIEVRALDEGVARVSVVPVPLRGPGVKLPPVADVARASLDDPRLFTSALWLMQTGEWQIRVTAEGARGAGTLAVPVPALARTARPMPRFLQGLLLALLALIVAGAIAIVGAGLWESDLPPGAAPDRRRRARGRAAMAVTAALLALAVAGGRRWWDGEAGRYLRLIYKPMQVTVTRPSPDTLALALADPGWLHWRRTDDLVPDHGHLMHLFLVRAPGLDAIGHLHPRRTGEGTFAQATPPLPAGSYRLFGDIVHGSGLDETVTAVFDLDSVAARAPALDAARFDADDAMAVIPAAATVAAPAFALPDGRGTVRWLDARAPRAGETVALEFEADGPDGAPVAGIEPYMGMAGHAMIVARDFSVFAHVHPTGSVPMAAMSLLEGPDGPEGKEGATAVDHAHHHGMTFAPRVRFPCVFPRAGDYRLFVQIKENGRVETAAWDLQVAPSR
ncbi:MAG TPA: hypothetical protein VHO06_28205 [Polyangia bacterium]|nr:hypothetical protein [Polyangia bacterium]